ncbi:MAG TPA: sensor domain-containing diguanylate cyclase [Candidatus Polarisedimenticolia bacterium]|jgi:diguanylate cyclase (GGDEF)-like protein
MLPSLGNTPLTTAILYPAAAALAGLIAGWAMARMMAGRRNRLMAHSISQEQHERESEGRDMRKTLHLLQNENTKLSTFLMTLPDLARQLNSSVEKRRIPQLLIGFLEQLFEADQILVFLTTQDGKHLTFASGKGLPDAVRGPELVPFGKGRIGWVAWHQITMDENDFLQKSRVSRDSGLDAQMHPLFRTELCAPMVSKDLTLGVISLGGLLRRPKNEKNMLKMVADLGSIAIQNTLLFSQIQASANSDGLTNLFNKRYFVARLAEEIIKAEKEQKTLSVFIFDIDHFKTYNDTNGHLAGDEALKITGRLLNESIRADDLAARYGGEEFIVLLPNTDKPGAVTAAEKIRRVVEAHQYPQQSSQPGGSLTISGGVATFPFDATNMQDLIRCADRGLYQGKRAGRNRIGVYAPKYLSDDTLDPSRQAAQGGQER